MNLLPYILMIPGLISLSSRKSRHHNLLHFPVLKVVLAALVVGGITFLLSRLLNFQIRSGDPVQTLLVSPLQEELIFRQPLVFLVSTPYYWPAAFVLGSIFIFLHRPEHMFNLVVLVLGTALLYTVFKRYGLLAALLAHFVLNLNSLWISALS